LKDEIKNKKKLQQKDWGKNKKIKNKDRNKNKNIRKYN
jgi:hypothetical protein